MIVQATGYKQYTQNIDLTEGNLPDIVQLELAASTEATTPAEPPPAKSTDTPEPTTTSVPPTPLPPTPTSIPLPTSVPDTSPGTILEVGETWPQGGPELTLKNVEFKPERERSGVKFELYFTNHKTQDISFNYRLNDNIVAIDNRTNRLKFGNFAYSFHECDPQVVVVAVGKTVYLECNWAGPAMAVVDIGDPAITEIIITVSGISSINEARWRIPISH